MIKQNNKNYLSADQLKEKITYLKEELAKNQKILDEKISEIDIINSNKMQENNNIVNNVNEEHQQNYNSLKIIEDLEKEIDLLLKDNAKLYEEKLMVLADGENLKRRLYEEELNIKKYRSFILAEKLLPVLDNFERALQINNINLEVKKFLMGFEMIHKLIKLAFIEENINEIKVKIGDVFDAKIHHAIEIVENNEIESGKIVQILQKGYKIYDRILRHVSVIIAK